MFQYATLKGIAAHHGYDYTLPPSDFNDPYHDHQLLEAFELSSLPRENIRINDTGQRLDEGHFHFNSNLYNNCPDNVDISGYFQSEKYFKAVSKQVKSDFTFKEEVLAPAKECREQVDSDEVISLHIRRGDYVNHPGHPCQTLEYYEKALYQIALVYERSAIPVIIVSDDPDWVLEQHVFSSDRFYVSQGNSNVFDMCLMTLCQYHIMANSSFSWWGAWLADSNKVIAPRQWFGPLLSEQHDTKDLLPSEWIKL
jgi:hypothetical protein